MFNLKNYQLSYFKGHLIPEEKSFYQFISLCGNDFLIRGNLDEYLGDEVEICGLPVWSSDSQNELFLHQISKSLIRRSC